VKSEDRMVEEPAFAEFLGRIRAGDARAAEELVRRYETAVRAVIRARLTDSSLRRQFDSIDVCQSVLASFFFRVSAGQFDLRDPEDLIALLVRMAQHKLSNRRRYHHQEQRDVRRLEDANSQALEVAATDPEPVQIIVGRELLDRARGMMTPEERSLADRRLAGHSWEEIAHELGGTAAARRKQYSRILARLQPLLGLEDDELG
jgi:RNA polymerase sigma factor (sigma-70 family)